MNFEKRETLFASAQLRQHRRKLFRTDIEVLAHSPPQHRSGDVATAAFLLSLVQYFEDDAFFPSEAVTDVRHL